MRRLLNTMTKARTGAQTIGSLTVSASLPVNTETYDLGVDEESVPAFKTKLLFCESLPVESKARSRMVIGTTVRLMTRLASAIGMALSPPNRLPRTAGPTKGTAGAEAVSAARAQLLSCMR